MSVVTSPSQLWTGGGATGAPSHARRLRHRMRTVVSEQPRLYLPLARRRYPGPSPRVVGPDTEAVIDGYTRSASTFAVYAFQLSQPRPVRLAHHLHAPAQLMEAARLRLPTIMVVREPRGAVLSQMVREPDVDLLDALFAYQRFHRSLMSYRDAFVVADFPEVTQRFGDVVRRANIRFGTDFGVFSGTETERAECNRMIEQRPVSRRCSWASSRARSRCRRRAHTWTPSRRCPRTTRSGRRRTPARGPRTGCRTCGAAPGWPTRRAAAEAAYEAFMDRWNDPARDGRRGREPVEWQPRQPGSGATSS